MIIYGKDNCPYCEMAKKLAPDAEYINLSDRADLREHFIEKGFKTVPIVYTDQIGYIGGYEELKEHLNENR